MAVFLTSLKFREIYQEYDDIKLFATKLCASAILVNFNLRMKYKRLKKKG